MHRFYFPACPVDGPVEPPVSFEHMASSGAVPWKCAHCECLFEGGCTRNLEEMGHYMHLDFGPCGIPGPTDPVIYEDSFSRPKAEIPRKCRTCAFLFNDTIHGFSCRKDRDRWGDFHRGLDWGAWAPDRIYPDIPHPKISTKTLIDHVHDGNLPAFVREHRQLNPGLSLTEAKEDFARLRHIIEQSHPKPLPLNPET